MLPFVIRTGNQPVTDLLHLFFFLFLCTTLPLSLVITCMSFFIHLKLMTVIFLDHIFGDQHTFYVLYLDI